MKNPAIRFTAFFFFVVSASAFASTWNFAWVGNDEVRYFFDADTVVKTRDRNILVWVKMVNTTKADSDGRWSTAARWKINCTKRTIQFLSWSSYGNDGKFLRSGSTPGTESEVIPDSNGEGMLKIACDPIFPNDMSEKNYFKIPGNDVFLATRIYVETMNSKIDNTPK